MASYLNLSALVTTHVVSCGVVTESTELLTEGGVSPFGDGDEGADDDSFNFLFEGGMTLP